MLKNKSAKKKVNKELLRRPDVYVTALSSKNELKAARSATTGEKFDTLDERIDHEVDRLNKKIDVTMLQQEDKESHVVENSVEGMTTNMVIKGRILQNLEPSNQVSMNIGSWNTFTNGSVSMYKPNTKYTVIVIVEDNKLNGEVQFIGDDNNVQTVFKTGINLKIASGSTGVFYKTYTTKDDLSNCVRVGYWVHNPNSITGTLRYSMLILEGDWTNKPISQYFEGIKSFGQEENKISILSHGKNFFNTKLFSEKINEKGELEFRVDGNSRINSHFIICAENDPSSTKVLVASSTNSKVFTTLNQEKYYLQIGLNGDKKDDKVWKEIKLPRNATCFYSANITVENINTVKFKDIQIEIGTSKTNYEEYKEDKKDILLQNLGFDEGLRGFDSTICDELNDIRGVAIKKIEKHIFNATEVWQKTSVGVGTDVETIRFQTVLNQAKDSNKFIANFPTLSVSTWDTDKENMQVSKGVFYVRIKKDKLESENADSFCKWLKQNPITVYYELAEPIETPLTDTINAKAFNERTYISFENALSGTSSFKAPVNAAATISRLNRENRALEEENKNLRQDFESTTLTLTDSDLELVKQNVDMDFRLMEVEFALDIPQAILSSNIKFKNKKGEVKSMARSPYEMMKIVILSGDYDKEDYMYKVGKYYERGRMTKEEHDELMSLMTADEVISK